MRVGGKHLGILNVRKQHTLLVKILCFDRHPGENMTVIKSRRTRRLNPIHYLGFSGIFANGIRCGLCAFYLLHALCNSEKSFVFLSTACLVFRIVFVHPLAILSLCGFSVNHYDTSIIVIALLIYIIYFYGHSIEWSFN